MEKMVGKRKDWKTGKLENWIDEDEWETGGKSDLEKVGILGYLYTTNNHQSRPPPSRQQFFLPEALHRLPFLLCLLPALTSDMPSPDLLEKDAIQHNAHFVRMTAI